MTTRATWVRRPTGRRPGRRRMIVIAALFAGLFGGSAHGGAPTEAEHANARRHMVSHHLAARDIDDPRVVAAMGKVPRHRFVPQASLDRAYRDHPLPIGHRQTISQPYIVALMTQLIRPTAGMKVLDVGTGSGYQAAILAEVVGKKGRVYGIEIVCPLAEDAARRLAALQYHNVRVKCGDGWRGWPEHAPFDAIVLAAAPRRVPQALVDQLAPGGRLVLPVGDDEQVLTLIVKQVDGSIVTSNRAPVRFVPMTGEALGPEMR